MFIIHPWIILPHKVEWTLLNQHKGKQGDGDLRNESISTSSALLPTSNDMHSLDKKGPFFGHGTSWDTQFQNNVICVMVERHRDILEVLWYVERTMETRNGF